MKKVIPPVLFMICSLIMIALHYYYPLLKLIPSFGPPAGILLTVTGLLFSVIVRKQFNKAKTEIHTFKKPEKLITGGLFRISRNPIYLGFTISLTGIWLISGMLSPFFAIVIFVSVTNFWYIPYEENNMERMFGKDYIHYKAQVRRWL